MNRGRTTIIAHTGHNEGEMMNSVREAGEKPHTIFVVTRTAGCSYYGASQEIVEQAFYGSWESAADTAWAWAKAASTVDRLNMLTDTAYRVKKTLSRGGDPLSPEYKKTNLWWAAKFPVLARDDEEAAYTWGGECETGPHAEVYVVEEVVLP